MLKFHERSGLFTCMFTVNNAQEIYIHSGIPIALYLDLVRMSSYVHLPYIVTVVSKMDLDDMGQITGCC